MEPDKHMKTSRSISSPPGISAAANNNNSNDGKPTSKSINVPESSTSHKDIRRRHTTFFLPGNSFLSDLAASLSPSAATADTWSRMSDRSLQESSSVFSFVSTPMDTLEIVETTKRKPSAIYDGYQYRRLRTNRDSVISWRCINERRANCLGMLKSKDGKVLQVSDHTCKPDPAATEVEKRLSNIRKRVREEDLPVSKIYKEEIESLFNHEMRFEIVKHFPSLPAIKSQLYRVRRNRQQSISEPTISEEIIIPD